MIVLFALVLCADPVQTHAAALAQKFIILDGHIDVPHRLQNSRNAQGELTEDITQATPKGNFDYPRAKAGGLDIPFFSIYTPAKFQDEGGAKRYAESLINMVEGIAKAAPKKFTMVKSVAEARAAAKAKKIGLALGMENGAPIESDIKNVAYFHQRGIRYITLTHAKDNLLSDSSYDEHHTWGGLSPFGKQVVAEMNRVGIMIDVSHLSDAAASQAITLSQAPVIASHSSCRHFTPGWERNISDELMQQLAQRGGVLQINFGSTFINDASRKRNKERDAKKDLEAKPPMLFATVAQVADHVDYAVKLIGIDHVGLGSDFDGVYDTLPEGLKDVSQYPNLIRELLQRGYTDNDIEKICATNVLRVWSAVEKYAASR